MANRDWFGAKLFRYVVWTGKFAAKATWWLLRIVAWLIWGLRKDPTPLLLMAPGLIALGLIEPSVPYYFRPSLVNAFNSTLLYSEAHPGVAAWAQALGVFLAVLFGGFVTKVVANASKRDFNHLLLNVLCNLTTRCRDACVALSMTSEEYVSGEHIGGSATEMLRSVECAMSEIPLHELQDPRNYLRILDIRTNIRDVLTMLEEHEINPVLATEISLASACRRTIRDCDVFLNRDANGFPFPKMRLQPL